MSHKYGDMIRRLASDNHIVIDDAMVDGFERAMRGKHYSDDDAWDSFLWFRSGWLGEASPALCQCGEK